jgi:hypothetical protein
VADALRMSMAVATLTSDLTGSPLDPPW